MSTPRKKKRRVSLTRLRKSVAVNNRIYGLLLHGGRGEGE